MSLNCDAAVALHCDLRFTRCRYASYLNGLLTGSIRLNPHPLYLLAVTVLGPVPDLDGRGGANLFLKIYQGDACLHTTDIL